MQSFKQYISEGTKGLTIFDIDDTMFKTKAKVEVKKDGKVVKVCLLYTSDAADE